MGKHNKVDRELGAACALVVLAIVSVSLVLLNVLQTFSLSKIFSSYLWLKAILCGFPLALSIFVLVPLLAGPQTIHKTRISMIIGIINRPLELLIISCSGAALHYFLPVLNPFVNVDVSQSPLTAYLCFSGILSGLMFYYNLKNEEVGLLNYPTFRIWWLARVKLCLKPTLVESLGGAQHAFKIFFVVWLAVTYALSLSIWPLIAPLFQLKIFVLFYLSQFLLNFCLAIAQGITTDPRIYQVDTPVVGEQSLVTLIKSKNKMEQNSAFQDLAILTRYGDPRRGQIFQLTIPGGKPKIWDALWSSTTTILGDFARKMEKINAPADNIAQSPTKKLPDSTKITNHEANISSPNIRNRFGEHFLWSKHSSMHSPSRPSQTQTMTTTANAEAMFLKKKNEEDKSLVTKIKDNLKLLIIGLFQSAALKIKSVFMCGLASVKPSIRPINYLISERPEYKISCLISEITTVRLCLIAASNILAAAPADDAYGVTQSALKPSIKIMKRLIKGLDILIRNNQQRVELRKLRNEARTALGKVTNAYGESLNEIL